MATTPTPAWAVVPFNDGWVIVSSGGGNAAELMWGFVILQKTNQ